MTTAARADGTARDALLDAIADARAADAALAAAVEQARSVNDPESIGRAKVGAILLFEASAARWAHVAQQVAALKKASDDGLKDERGALAALMEQAEAELKSDGVVVDFSTEFHTVALAAPGWVVEVVGEDALPQEVFKPRQPDKNKIARWFKERGHCSGARLARGGRYVQIKAKRGG